MRGNCTRFVKELTHKEFKSNVYAVVVTDRDR
jgi:hypothetical protein